MSDNFWDMLGRSYDEWEAGTERVQRYLNSKMTVIVADGTVDGSEAWVFTPRTMTLAVSADLEARARDLFPEATFVKRNA